MSQVKFISGDGVEHEVEETSMAAEIMRQNGFQQIGDHPAAAAAEGSDEPDDATEAEAPAPAKKKAAAKKG